MSKARQKAPPVPPATKAGAALFLMSMLLGLVLFNAAARGWIGEKKLVPAVHKENVVVIPQDPDSLAKAPAAKDLVLLIGDSHTYALPGLNKGEPLREEMNATLIDELGTRVDALAGRPVMHARIAYPNFVPLEILTRFEQLLENGYKPRIVVFGWHWPSVSRDRSLRPQIRKALRNQGLSDRLIERLSRPEVNADPEIIEALRAEQRQVDAELEEERQRSGADRIEEPFREALDEEVYLLGGGPRLRAKIWREMVIPVQERLAKHERDHTYDVIDADLAFNRKALVAMIRLMKSEGVYLYTYFAPERPDMTAVIDTGGMEEAIADFTAEASKHGFTSVDGRHVVPGDVWGWAGDYPDRSHFTERGHQALAEFLTTNGTEVWSRLSDDRAEAYPTSGGSL